MQQVVQQLQAVRETGRRMLLAQRAMRWLAIFLVLALAIVLVLRRLRAIAAA